MIIKTGDVMKKIKDLSDLAKAWPSPFVARNKLEIFSGGMVTAASMAVFDSKGTGIPERFIVNRKTIYKVIDVVAWLESKVLEKHSGLPHALLSKL